MEFQVSKSSHNSRTKHYFANPRIKIQENMTRSLQKPYLHITNGCVSMHDYYVNICYVILFLCRWWAYPYADWCYYDSPCCGCHGDCGMRGNTAVAQEKETPWRYVYNTCGCKPVPLVMHCHQVSILAVWYNIQCNTTELLDRSHSLIKAIYIPLSRL